MLNPQPNPGPQRLLKHAAMQIGAGGSAGFVEICLLHPLDLVKTRFQIQRQVTGTPGNLQYYNSLADCFQKMYRHEGLASFWKGILPPIAVETPKQAIKFLLFEQFKGLFMFGSPVPTPLTFLAAGLCAGLMEGALVNPFEVVKVKLQADHQRTHLTPSTWSVTKEIIAKEGIGFQGLNKGLTATLGRNGVGNMIYFGFYYSMKSVVPESKDPRLDFLRRFGIGFTSGAVTSVINIPFDVAKSRIQGPQPQPGIVKYRGTLSTISIVYREEGYLALYKGLIPKILRLGPGGAILIVAYEYTYDFFKRTFPD